jgi:DNA-directed RNA polymerase specialized sigma24 family protein
MDFEYEKEINDFAFGDDGAAAKAFERIFEAARPTLLAFVRRKVQPPMDAEDIVQDVAVRTLLNRAKFKPMGWNSWLCFLRRCALWTLLTRVREDVEIPFESVEDLPIADIISVESIVDARIDREAIRRAADIVLLGIDPTIEEQVLVRHLLAAKMYFVDGNSWSEIASFLSSSRPYEKPINRDDLDSWFSERSTLLKLFYHTLYMSPAELSDHIIDSPSGEPDSPRWTEVEERLIVMRYENALLFEQIVRRDACTLSESELCKLYVRCAQYFPFTKRMRSLLSTLGANATGLGLAKPHLWQRLAFEYWVFDTLPRNDIGDRTNSPAIEAGTQVNDSRLNAWLSEGRLAHRICNYLRKVVGE